MTLPVDIVVPVYNAPRDLRRCVESVLAHTRPPYALVLIDDASPDPGVAAYFDELAQRGVPGLALLRNERNLGFTGTANRGMTRSRADVVLLNSDAVVTEGWLDALVRCAASDASIGTITPFSNNAEIASFPALCVNHRWPEDADPEPTRRAIAEAAVPCYPELPTGVGFCMFVRRAMLDAIGPFDPAFGAGYGEENDLCMRAVAAGWRNVLCDDAFVLHTGGRSFEGAKATLGVRNTALLVERHPAYPDVVREFIERDPLRPLREAAQTAYDRMFGPPLGVLHVLHGGGGTEAYVRTLADATRGRARHALAMVQGDTWTIEELRSDGTDVRCQFGRRPDEPLEDFIAALCAAYGAGVVHVHNVSGSRERLQQALPRLAVPYVYTVHDLNFACPTITLHRPDGFFCGGVTDPAVCNPCLAAQGLGDIDIVRWRQAHAPIVRAAAAVMAPSRWAAGLLERYFPGAKIDVVPHAVPERAPRRGGAVQVVLMPRADVATVAIVGAIGPDKGARRVERLAQLAAERDAPVRFVVVGYLDRQSSAWQSDDGRLTVNGPYDPVDLATLLDHYGASLVVYPSAGPETFAFTLSEVWKAGRAVLVPPIGALAERVDAHGAGWILSDDEWRDEARMLERVVELVSPVRREALRVACARALAMPLPAMDAMVDATLDVYARAQAARPVVHPPVERLRVVEALGYRRWSMPRMPATGDAANAAQEVPNRDRSPMRRVLRRLVSPHAVQALKSRLR